MAETILVVILIAVVLYGVTGGADFGAGMIEPLLGRKGREHVDAALLPVWEANHVWLVLVAVLTFVAFPALFVSVITYLHIPVLMVLLGIVARGSAFTFRHYDPKPGVLGAWYSAAFRAGSFLTPLFLGIIAAAMLEGRLPTQCQGSFYDVFVGPWNTPFGWATGVFTCLLFAFQGAALLAAELRRHDGALPLIRLARGLHLAAIAWGFLVAGLAWHGAHAWFQAALRNPVSLGCVLLSVLLTPVVAYGFQRGMPWTVRLSTAAQLVCVLIGFFAADYPVLLRQRGGTITLADAAPPAVLASLLVAVGVGLLLILPSLAYLFKVYKLQR